MVTKTLEKITLKQKYSFQQPTVKMSQNFSNNHIVLIDQLRDPSINLFTPKLKYTVLEQL